MKEKNNQKKKNEEELGLELEKEKNGKRIGK